MKIKPDKKNDIAELRKGVHCVHLEESFQTHSNAYLPAKFGFDTAENEPCKICPIDVVRPRVRDDAEDPREARVAASCLEYSKSWSFEN